MYVLCYDITYNVHMHYCIYIIYIVRYVHYCYDTALYLKLLPACNNVSCIMYIVKHNRSNDTKD